MVGICEPFVCSLVAVNAGGVDHSLRRAETQIVPLTFDSPTQVPISNDLHASNDSRTIRLVSYREYIGFTNFSADADAAKSRKKCYEPKKHSIVCMCLSLYVCYM